MERFEIVLACPSCHVGARLTAFEPDDTDQAITWTDGYREIAGVPPPLQLVRCCACNAFYWTDMATPVLEPLASDSVAEIETPDENSYYEAIDRGLGSDQERELALRVLAWWRGNDRFRKDAARDRYPTDRRAIRNIERLVDLCGDGNHEILLTRVEALRQLGRFDEASETLAGICSDYELAAVRYGSLIAAHSRHLEILFD